MPRCKQTGPRRSVHLTLRLDSPFSPLYPQSFSAIVAEMFILWRLLPSLRRVASQVFRGVMYVACQRGARVSGWVVTACECSRRLVFIERPPSGETLSGRKRGRGRGSRRVAARAAGWEVLARARSAGPLRARRCACLAPPHRGPFYLVSTHNS